MICKFMPVKNAKEVQLPTRGTANSAGYDFYAPCDIEIKPGEKTAIIPFNVKCALPENKYLQLVIRSSLSMKYGVTLLGSGVIDADYFGNPENDGNIGACFVNLSKQKYVIKKGERCMQGIILDYYTTDDDKPVSLFRNGGFGSTGK